MIALPLWKDETCEVLLSVRPLLQFVCVCVVCLCVFKACYLLVLGQLSVSPTLYPGSFVCSYGNP